MMPKVENKKVLNRYENLFPGCEVGRLPTVSIKLDQKPVLVLHLDEDRLFDKNPGNVKYFY